MFTIGIDLGSTNIVAGLVDDQYNILTTATVKTNLPREAEAIIRQAQEQAKQMVTKEAIYAEAKRRAEEMAMQAQNRVAQIQKAGNSYMDESLRQTEEVISQALSEVRETRMKFRTLTDAQEQRKNAPSVDVEL